MSKRMQQRRQRPRQSRHKPMPYVPLRFTPTRATRRMLADVVQGLVKASTRFALLPVRRSHRSHTLALQGWPDAVRLEVCAEALALVVTHEGQWWDCLIWPDCQPQMRKGGWRCALCEQDAPPGTVYRKLADLWWAHLAQPLLDYLAALPAQAVLHVSCAKGGGITWAEVLAADAATPARKPVLASWPLGSAA